MITAFHRAVVRFSACALFLGAATSVLSAPVSVSFQDGSNMMGYMSYDTSIGSGDILDGEVTVSGVTYTFAPQPSAISSLPGIIVQNNVGSPAFDSVAFFIGVSGPNISSGMDLYRPSYLLFALDDSTASVLSSTTTPSDPYILNSFGSRIWSLQFERLNADGTGSGGLSGFGFGRNLLFQASVPEPSSFALFALVLPILIAVNRRRPHPASMPRRQM